MCDSIQRITPKLLFQNSKEHFEAYTVIRNNVPSDDDFYLWDIKYFLLCRCIELYLKSVLLSNKLCKVADLRISYKHNLIKLLNKACNDNLITLTTNEYKYISLINDLYKKKFLEYRQVGYKKYPEITVVENICIKLLQVKGN